MHNLSPQSQRRLKKNWLHGIWTLVEKKTMESEAMACIFMRGLQGERYIFLFALFCSHILCVYHFPLAPTFGLRAHRAVIRLFVSPAGESHYWCIVAGLTCRWLANGGCKYWRSRAQGGLSHRSPVRPRVLPLCAFVPSELFNMGRRSRASGSPRRLSYCSRFFWML